MNKQIDIRKTIQSEFNQYEEAFAASLQADNALLNQVLDYIHSKRGKQLRPILVLLSAALCRGVTDKSIQTAVALELMHTASLIHDDVVDDYFTQVKNGIIDIIAAEPSQGEYALDLLMIAKYFERIGDHCTNIAEWVEFSVTGVHKDCQ